MTQLGINIISALNRYLIRTDKSRPKTTKYAFSTLIKMVSCCWQVTLPIVVNFLCLLKILTWLSTAVRINFTSMARGSSFANGEANVIKFLSKSMTTTFGLNSSMTKRSTSCSSTRLTVTKLF